MEGNALFKKLLVFLFAFGLVSAVGCNCQQSITLGPGEFAGADGGGESSVLDGGEKAVEKTPEVSPETQPDFPKSDCLQLVQKIKIDKVLVSPISGAIQNAAFGFITSDGKGGNQTIETYERAVGDKLFPKGFSVKIGKLPYDSPGDLALSHSGWEGTYGLRPVKGKAFCGFVFWHFHNLSGPVPTVLENPKTCPWDFNDLGLGPHFKAARAMHSNSFVTVQTSPERDQKQRYLIRKWEKVPVAPKLVMDKVVEVKQTSLLPMVLGSTGFITVEGEKLVVVRSYDDGSIISKTSPPFKVQAISPEGSNVIAGGDHFLWLDYGRKHYGLGGRDFRITHVTESGPNVIVVRKSKSSSKKLELGKVLKDDGGMCTVPLDYDDRGLDIRSVYSKGVIQVALSRYIAVAVQVESVAKIWTEIFIFESPKTP